MQYEVVGKSGLVFGLVVHKLYRGSEGWRFFPRLNNRRPSIKVYGTPQAAVPRWARDGELRERC